MDFTEKVFFPPPCFYQLGFNFGFNFYNLPNIRACLLYVFALRYCFFKLLVYYPLRGEYKISRDRARLSRFDSIRENRRTNRSDLYPIFFFFFLSTVQKEGGTQLKLQINYSNMQALFKPMR